MQAGINRTSSASSRIAGFGAATDSGDMAAGMVGLRQGAIDVKAAANIIKAGDEMMGTLIDLRA